MSCFLVLNTNYLLEGCTTLILFTYITSQHTCCLDLVAEAPNLEVVAVRVAEGVGDGDRAGLRQGLLEGLGVPLKKHSKNKENMQTWR